MTPADLRDVAVRLAREAGEMALAGRRAGRVSATTKSSPTDMVTEFDRASERMICDGLATARPDDAIVGEEGASRPGTTGLTWHIDPIDGTSNFYFDLPMWAVSIGVTDRHGPLAGAVFAPALGDMWAGARGLGATLNDSPIEGRDNGSLTDAMVCTGYSYRVSERAQHARRVSNMITEVRDIRRFGAAALDICLVATGRLDAYFEEHLHSWDLVAAQIIATEAGAIVTDYAGGPVTPDQVLAASSRIHAPMVELLARAGGTGDGSARPGGR